jgi:hypothetical protein
MAASSAPLAGFEQDCVVCARGGEPITMYGHASVVIIAGGATPPPATIVFCDRCVQ